MVEHNDTHFIEFFFYLICHPLTIVFISKLICVLFIVHLGKVRADNKLKDRIRSKLDSAECAVINFVHFSSCGNWVLGVEIDMNLKKHFRLENVNEKFFSHDNVCIHKRANI